MEVTSSVAKGLILSAELLRLSQCFCKSIQKAKYPGHEIATLSDKLEAFAHFYKDFFTSSAFESRPIRRLISWTEETIDALRRLLKRVRSWTFISRDSLIGNVAARVKWSLHENEVKCLRLSLGVATESINALMNILNIEKLHQQMDALKSAMERSDRRALEEQLGMTLNALYQTLKNNRNNCRKQRHAIDHRLKEAKIELFQQYDGKSQDSEIVPSPERLLRLMKSVERYTERVLPKHKAGERRRSSNIDICRQQYPSPENISQSSGTTRSASRASSPSSPGASRSPFYPARGYDDVVHESVERSQEYANASNSRANFATFPDLTELLGLVKQTNPRIQSNEEGNLHVANYSRKPQYDSASSTQLLHRTANKPGGLPPSGLVAREQVPPVPSEARQEILGNYQTYAYDDVSSEDETEEMRWNGGARRGLERSVSPEGL